MIQVEQELDFNGIITDLSLVVPKELGKCNTKKFKLLKSYLYFWSFPSNPNLTCYP